VSRSTDDTKRAFLHSLHVQHPGFVEAVLADARLAAMYRGERAEHRSKTDAARQVLRLCWASDAFAAQVLYRLKASLQARRVPVIPRLAHHLAMVLSQVSIGDPVIIEPGVYLIHGQVVIDGLVRIGSGTVIAPWVTIGLRAGNIQGPTIDRDVHVGTGAKVIGPVRLGAGSQVGANSVVVSDVAPGATVMGAPARPASG
jgi:serine O-acetyltransferase